MKEFNELMAKMNRDDGYRDAIREIGEFSEKLETPSRILVINKLLEMLKSITPTP